MTAIKHWLVIKTHDLSGTNMFSFLSGTRAYILPSQSSKHIIVHHLRATSDQLKQCGAKDGFRLMLYVGKVFRGNYVLSTSF